LGERLNGIQEVGGSTPPGSTNFQGIQFPMRRRGAVTPDGAGKSAPWARQDGRDPQNGPDALTRVGRRTGAEWSIRK
jgi:hypothetical protein